MDPRLLETDKQRNKRKPKGQKGQNVIINKVDKDCVLDKSRKVITEVVKNSCKGSLFYHIRVFFIFLDNLKVIHEVLEIDVVYI